MEESASGRFSCPVEKSVNKKKWREASRPDRLDYVSVRIGVSNGYVVLISTEYTEYTEYRKEESTGWEHLLYGLSQLLDDPTLTRDNMASPVVKQLSFFRVTEVVET